jgi:hypothetical protein
MTKRRTIKICLVSAIILSAFFILGCKEDNPITGTRKIDKDCEGPYPVVCDFSGEDINRNELIRCKTDDDCSSEKMRAFCSPGIAELSSCDSGSFFCDSGSCRSCECE